jgi:signal transduction histidine kinase
MRQVARLLNRTLRGRIFLWFGFSIFLTAVGVAAATHLTGSESPWREASTRIQAYLGHQFAVVWNHPEQRRRLAEFAAADLDTSVVVVDAHGTVLHAIGEPCGRPDLRAPVLDGVAPLGEVRLCKVWAFRTRAARVRPFAIIAVAALMLWLASAVIARRLTRPLARLVRVTEELGQGNLQSRVRLNRRWPGEFGTLAASVNRMAARIEQQMNDQRELLAGVSHELRSPLARIRVALELVRDLESEHQRSRAASEIEREVWEMDSLVGELLASSRLQFAVLDEKRVSAAELAREALRRTGSVETRLVRALEDDDCELDPTLAVRALMNLLENARRHGGGANQLTVSGDVNAISWAVEDSGPGFRPSELPRVFLPFVRGEGEQKSGSSLGLGLALVERIAHAHGGRAWAENRPDGGARVAITLPRRRVGRAVLGANDRTT